MRKTAIIIALNLSLNDAVSLIGIEGGGFTELIRLIKAELHLGCTGLRQHGIVINYEVGEYGVSHHLPGKQRDRCQVVVAGSANIEKLAPSLDRTLYAIPLFQGFPAHPPPRR